MGQQLTLGDVFFVPPGARVSVPVPGTSNETSVEVGRVYKRKTNFSEDRFFLKSSILSLILKRGIKVDYDKISAFVEENIPDRPSESFCFSPGDFVVTGVERSDRSTDEVVQCRRLEPTGSDQADAIRIMQNSSGTGHYPYEVIGKR